MSNLTDVTDGTFTEQVLESDKPVLVDFWAEWCGPCRVLTPILEDLAKEHTGVKVVKLDIEANPQMASKYGILSIPTLMLFEQGEVKHTLVGAYPKRKLESEFNLELTK